MSDSQDSLLSQGEGIIITKRLFQTCCRPCKNSSCEFAIIDRSGLQLSNVLRWKNRIKRTCILKGQGRKRISSICRKLCQRLACNTQGISGIGYWPNHSPKINENDSLLTKLQQLQNPTWINTYSIMLLFPSYSSQPIIIIGPHLGPYSTGEKPNFLCSSIAGTFRLCPAT